MEAVGVSISSRCLVIRGIADYADSHKNDLWKHKAAGNAAVFAKELLLKMNPGVLEELSGVSSQRNPITTLPQTLSPDPNFVGRGEIIERLRGSLTNNDRVALVGLGGIGKTEIAVQFAHMLRDENPKTHIFWVYGATRSSFDEAYRKIADELEIPGRHEALFDARVEVPKLLEDLKYGPWIMIIDNADDHSVFFPPQEGVLDRTGKRNYLTNCLPSGAKVGGKIIITTRNQRVGDDLMSTGVPIQVSELAPSDATQLLKLKIPSEKWVDEPAEMLVAELGYIPLAITQAAAFLKCYKMASLKFYLGKLNQFHLNVKDVLSKELYDSRREAGTPNAIFHTWQISYEQIRLEDIRTAEKLSLMAVFDNQAIPGVLLRQDEEFDIAELSAVQRLLDFSLIKGDFDSDSYYMHPLQQMSTQNWLRTEELRLEKWQDNALILLSQRMPLNVGTEKTYERSCAILLPHALVALSYNTNNRICFAELSDSYEALYELYGDAHFKTTYAKYMIGVGFSRLGKYDDSKRVLEDVLRHGELLSGDHQKGLILEAMDYLAVAYIEMGDDEAALALVDRAIIKCEALSNKEGKLGFLVLQARLLLRESKYQEAANLFKQVLKDRIEIFGETAAITLNVMSGYSIALRHFDRAESERYSRLAIKGWEILRGRDHPHTMMGIVNYAFILEDKGHLVEAELLLRQTLDDRQRILGMRHPDTIDTLVSLARVLGKLEIFDEAESLCRQILIAFEGITGLVDVCRSAYPNVPDHSLIKEGRLDEAETVLSGDLEEHGQPLEVVDSKTTTSTPRSTSLAKEKPFGDDKTFSRSFGQDSIGILHILASCLKGQGKYEEAEKYQRQLLELQTQRHGTGGLHTLKCKVDLAHILHLYAKHDKALQLMQEVFDGFDQHVKQTTSFSAKDEVVLENWRASVLRGEIRLAFKLHVQERNEEALAILQEAIRMVKTLCPGKKALLVRAEKEYNVVFRTLLLERQSLVLDMREIRKLAEAGELHRNVIETLKRWDPENLAAIREAEQNYIAWIPKKFRTPQTGDRSATVGQKGPMFSFFRRKAR